MFLGEKQKWIQWLFLLLFGKINEVILKRSDKSGEIKQRKVTFKNKGIDLILCRFSSRESWYGQE